MPSGNFPQEVRDSVCLMVRAFSKTRKISLKSSDYVGWHGEEMENKQNQTRSSDNAGKGEKNKQTENKQNERQNNGPQRCSYTIYLISMYLLRGFIKISLSLECVDRL